MENNSIIPTGTSSLEREGAVDNVEQASSSTRHATENEPEPPRRPRRTLLGSMRKPYKKPLVPINGKTWTEIKFKARQDESDDIVAESEKKWNEQRMRLKTLDNRMDDEEKTREYLDKSAEAREAMSRDRLFRKNEAVQNWNQYFNTFYSLV